MVTFLNVVVNVAIVLSAVSIAYSKIVHVFTMRMDFCSNWRNQRYISSISASNATSAMVGISKNVTIRNFGFT